MVKEYAPTAIILQCGADGLFQDPLLAGHGWNLSAADYAEAVKLVIGFKIPSVLLGGGGYDPYRCAVTWTRCTAVATDRELSEWIPEHTYWDRYAPLYAFTTETGCQNDENSIQDVEQAMNSLILHCAVQL